MQEAKTHDMIPKQQSPAYLFALIVLSIFVAEALVMLLLDFVFPGTPEIWQVFVDSSLLVLLVFPVIYFFGFRPLENRVKERIAAQNELISALEKLETRNHESKLLSNMSDMLQSCVSFDEAYSIIAKTVQQLFKGQSGALFVLSASRNVSEKVLSWGGLEIRCGSERVNNEDCLALRRGQVHLVEDQVTGFTCASMMQSLSKGYVCIPLIVRGETIGLFQLMSEKEVVAEPMQELAATLARQVSLALANLKLNDALRVQSIRDPLTGLFNRRYLESSLERELHKAARKNTSLGIIMLDIDHFKEFNDTFGHLAGDTVLRELGVFLRKQVREEDIACRYGGEEFTLMLPDASLEKTMQRAEHLREGMKSLRLVHQGQAMRAVTLSLGVAAFPAHGPTAEGIINAADKALYSAKEQGRDRVVVAEPKIIGDPEDMQQPA